MEEHFQVGPHFLQMFLPVSSRTRTSTLSIQLGTPEILVTFLFIVSRAIRSRFTSKSLNKAVCFLGTLTKLAKGLIFSMRMALKSPTKLPETL